jgi:hypothetical protein
MLVKKIKTSKKKRFIFKNTFFPFLEREFTKDVPIWNSYPKGQFMKPKVLSLSLSLSLSLYLFG